MRLSLVLFAALATLATASGCEVAGPGQASPPADHGGLPDAKDPGPEVLEDAAEDDLGGEDAVADPGGVPELPPPSDVSTAPPDASLGPQPVGGVCAKDADCEDGYCNTAYPGGYCSAKCSKDADCPEASKCYADPKAGGKMCWKACAGKWECRLDQFCPAGANICTPKCQDGDCNAGYVCDAVGGACIFASSAPTCEPMTEACNGVDDDCDKVSDEGCGFPVSTSPSVITEDLGLWTVGGGGLSNTIKFKVSEAASAFTVVVQADDVSEEILVVWELKSPSGKVLVTGTDPLASPIRAFPGVGIVTVQVPNTPVVAVEAGTHTLTLYREGEVSEVWVKVIQTLRPNATKSTLDVNFWFTDIPGLSASKAPNDAKFGKLVAELKEVLAPYGVTVGTVGYFDVPATVAKQYAYLDTQTGYAIDEHAKLLALSKTLPDTNRGVNFFFVQGFTGGWSLLGRAGGIPGPPLVHGSFGSGVAVSLADYLFGDVEVTAHTMAHELGHQLGLFHVTEQNGEMWDPIPDTAECHDMNGDGYVDTNECLGKGADNLMFWAATPWSTAKLTAGQLYVIHKNACLY